MRVPQAVKTKCVMGELTLGDVLNLITSKFSYVCVEQDGSQMGRYNSWCINDENMLSLYCDENTPDYEFDFQFNLRTKVRIKNDGVEWDEDGVKTCLHFLETKVIGLEGILP